ncbi:MAG: nucleoside triphosphate pyrophosphohydrolase family protein [Clostridiales bacterium]|nr:nucleoside triphosphate pyrophosphohydrolase family protein [Clostridiales bacterium]
MTEKNVSPLDIPQNANHYQHLARRTQNTGLSIEDKRKHAAFGLMAEAGEVAGLFQHFYQGAEISKDEVIKELGDCLWFISEMCDTYGVSIMEVMRRNIAKLMKRYPEGFNVQRSTHRHEYGED